MTDNANIFPHAAPFDWNKNPRRVRCRGCGREFEHMKPSYGWHNCPNCGAEVKR